jgi:serine/threonine protein kinase
MDFIENVDPNEILLLPDDELQTLRIQLVNALNCLRSYGIFHNDSHSQNIFFTRGEGQLVPYVIDFGKTHSVSSYPTSLGLVDFNLTSGLSEHDMDESFRRWIKGINLSREEREKYNTISKSGDTNIIFGGKSRGRKGILKKSKSKKRKSKMRRRKTRTKK